MTLGKVQILVLPSRLARTDATSVRGARAGTTPLGPGPSNAVRANAALAGGHCGRRAAVGCALGLAASQFIVMSPQVVYVNWKPGKTECFLRYRGRQAAAKLQARRTGPDSSLVVAVPGTPHVITVVGKYKHLGGVTCADQSIAADAQCKRRAAAAAYGPLAVKIFASTKVEEELKLQLMWSLVMSRLLYNVHVIVPTRAYLRALNGVYMRGVRRIGDQCRF